MRCALSRPTLIEKHDAIAFGIEELSVLRNQAGAWSAVKKYDRLTFGIAALLVIQFMQGRNSEPPTIEGFNWGIKIFHGKLGRRLLELWLCSQSLRILKCLSFLLSALTLRSLRLCGESWARQAHRRDAEAAKATQRKTEIKTRPDSQVDLKCTLKAGRS